MRRETEEKEGERERDQKVVFSVQNEPCEDSACAIPVCVCVRVRVSVLTYSRYERKIQRVTEG